MAQFLNDDFMLNNKTAVLLYHQYAEKMPIFDYHCHINPNEIAENKTYENITQLWLYGDHYKWRAMRTFGVDERYITGDATDRERFQKWAETMPYCVGSPMYLWSHLELKRYFGVEKELSPDTAEEIWNACNEVIRGGQFTVRKIVERSGVSALCTTDNPVDSLEAHKKLKADGSFSVKVFPAFRPDVFVNVDKPGFTGWIEKLEAVCGTKIKKPADLLNALRARIDYFHDADCRLSDHALDPIVYKEFSEDEIPAILTKALNGDVVDAGEAAKYKTWLMLFFGREYARRGWVMQYHMNSVRNVNSKMFGKMGPDTGYDAIGTNDFAQPLYKMLDTLNSTDELPKVMLYSLNPNDYEVMATIGSAFNGGVTGKVQLGAAWWFNDHISGIERQLTVCANNSLLSLFVGMLTDSRSFISYPRHEYFRRVLCNLLGRWAENGEITQNTALLGRMVEDICFNNARRYFEMF